MGLMLAKFHDPRVLAKRGGSSVTIDGNLDRMPSDAVWKHFVEEIEERRLAGIRGSPIDRAGEDVDVANMAFLDWWVQRRESRGASRKGA